MKHIIIYIFISMLLALVTHYLSPHLKKHYIAKMFVNTLSILLWINCVIGIAVLLVIFSSWTRFLYDWRAFAIIFSVATFILFTVCQNIPDWFEWLDGWEYTEKAMLTFHILQMESFALGGSIEYWQQSSKRGSNLDLLNHLITIVAIGQLCLCAFIIVLYLLVRLIVKISNCRIQHGYEPFVLKKK